MLLGHVFERFAAKTPFAVMARSLMERTLAPETLDALFDLKSDSQYTRELTFSSVVVVRARRVVVKLDEATEDGDRELVIVTNLPASVSAVVVAEVYRERWTIEIIHPDYRSSDKLGWSLGPACPGGVRLATTRPVASFLLHQDARRHHMSAPRRRPSAPKN